ncbi:unnamed protein product [Spirodela intermedia]|uniref:Uncharacterized protein n=1 Tax=Spirodela intermedia TaxID=51605 RepID=A0A7I8KBE9_SPIIN|nr:unnamed protein product [Spirodela intermedia]
MTEEEKKSSACGLTILCNSVFRRQSHSDADCSNSKRRHQKDHRKPPELQAPPPRDAAGITGKLDVVLYDHQRAQGSGTPLRASPSNVILVGNLGNLRRGNTPPPSPPAGKMLRHLPKPVKTPDELKDMGNEEYRKGKFVEALALYDRAILISPETAAYWSNKAAALTELGRFLEAANVCREAVRIEPGFCRAHHRLAKLYIRLGEAGKALHHYGAAGSEASFGEVSQAKNLQSHIDRSSEARKRRDWRTVLKEVQYAISAGADSAPQVFASQAEALLKLQRHQEANAAFINVPAFDVDASTMFFGPPATAYFLSVRAQVHMAIGRFDEALSTAQRAVRVDSGSEEAAAVARRTRAAALSRSRGNELFKVLRFADACAAYGEGLQQEPLNSVLLCNRAAALCKLKRWEEAVEDCTMALLVRPPYHKARLRRAQCYAKMERWRAAVEDYEILAREMAGDEAMESALLEARRRLEQGRDGESGGVGSGGNVVIIRTKDQFDRLVASSGTCVAFFCNKSEGSDHIWFSAEELWRKYPTVNFLKVDREDNPYLVKPEEQSSVPSFKMYKNGSKIEELSRSDFHLLEGSLRVHSI